MVIKKYGGTMPEMMVLFSLLALTVVIVITVALARWAFRINEILTCLVTIIDRMDKILELAKRQNPAR
jgi:hypothetical protein